MKTDYADFLHRKTQLGGEYGFEPKFMPDCLFPFQAHLAEWNCHKGRSADFADCGLGKTLIQLVWAQNVHLHTGQPVLIVTPLAVGHQTVREGTKFGIECLHSKFGRVTAPITVTNYQKLHKFNPDDYAGVVCDESSILKNFDGAIKAQITDFMRKRPYRLLCTATAAPNDYIELGTSSEALGELGFMDMIGRFFKKAETTMSRSDEFRAGVYRFRGHAERYFWRWVCSWARAVRQPSDLGFSNEGFELPPLVSREHIVKGAHRNPEMLFDLPAVGLQEQRAERRNTIQERCEIAAELCAKHEGPSIAWCHLNDEGDLLERLIPNCAQVKGGDADEKKEETVEAFLNGQVQNLVGKSTIVGFGMNFQHCAHQTHFPSHSFEQMYQAVRRSWRFGQKQSVSIDMIASEGEAGVLANLRRKEAAAEEMFTHLVGLINDSLKIETVNAHTRKQKLPAFLS